ncbi:hypothetical protein ACHAWO_009202 [Cyclotella atomus]|uniref:DUF2061 domain-containing protein n=1 Tax=Cyclotella atomus TaxID=382360 RepID=A0ABD3QVR7_9STRA
MCGMIIFRSGFCHQTPPIVMSALPFLQLVLLALAVQSFQPTLISQTRPPRRYPKPPIPPSSLSSTADSNTNSAMLRQIDQKIQRYERKQQKYLSRLQTAKAELEKYQQTRQQYLNGTALGSTSNSSFSETTARSLVKSMMWRLIAGSVTFFTSLRFSKSFSTALSIVGSDFFSKAATMFIGERIMNTSQAGRKSGADDVGRSLAKALLWRVFAICNTLTMSFLIAKDLSMASKIAGSDAVFKTGLMFVYERAWAKVEWGKEYIIEFSI